MISASATPVVEAAHTLETQQDISHDHDSQNLSPRGRESPCDPYLSFDFDFDGIAHGSKGDQSQTPVARTRSMRSNISVTESAADSQETDATSVLPALQTKGSVDDCSLQPLREDEMDPRSFDLVAPSNSGPRVYSLERRSELLFSKEHMGSIITNPRLLGQFMHFLHTERPASVPLLAYYLDTEKAIRAIKYANAVTEALKRLDGHEFTTGTPDVSLNQSLQAKHDSAFEALARDELPMFITHVWIQTVSLSIKHRIVGTMPSHLRDASEGLAEVFCLTDPSRHDNPIILASSEFHRTTQYGINYVIGRNCRFLQGPATNPFSVKRIRDRLAAGQEHFETFLNYRRDGSPFLNLLLCAPLLDSRGQVRYFLGAQVDVSGLAKECTGLEGLKHIVASEGDKKTGMVDTLKVFNTKAQEPKKNSVQCCRELSKMFDRTELDEVRRHGGSMHKKTGQDEFSRRGDSLDAQSYLVIEDSTSAEQSPQATSTVPSLETGSGDSLRLDHAPNGCLAGVYKHYLLVRPAPSLQILFASPSLRVPGILQSSFLSRIGGSGRVRNKISQTLTEGHGVTARVRWVSSTRREGSASDRGRHRWIHCTPMRGVNGVIGIWMVVIVDEDDSDLITRDSTSQYKHGLKPKLAPPVAHITQRPASYMTADGRSPVYE